MEEAIVLLSQLWGTTQFWLDNRDKVVKSKAVEDKEMDVTHALETRKDRCFWAQDTKLDRIIVIISTAAAPKQLPAPPAMKRQPTSGDTTGMQ
eukprot:7043365-Karenia_brevis.AAC.1